MQTNHKITQNPLAEQNPRRPAKTHKHLCSQEHTLSIAFTIHHKQLLHSSSCCTITEQGEPSSVPAALPPP